MRHLLWLFLLAPVFGQNVRIDNIAFGPKGPVPNARVAVCSQPANTAIAPCSPLIPLCSSTTDTACTQPNPLISDGLGNYHFYAPQASAPYTIQVFGPSVAAPYVMTDQLGAGSTQNAGSAYTATQGFQATPPVLLDLIFAVDPSGTCAYVATILNAGQLQLCNAGGGVLTINPGTGPLNLTETITNGTAAMTTSAIGSGACGATVTVPAYGVVATDTVVWSYAAPVGANPGQLVLNAWPTINNVNFAFCNGTAGSITPTAATINWRLLR